MLCSCICSALGANSCSAVENPFLLKTGAMVLTYTNVCLFTQVITFSKRPGLHTFGNGLSSLNPSLTHKITQLAKKSIFIWTLLLHRNVSAQQMAGYRKVEAILMIYNLCAGEVVFIFFFSAAHIAFFCPLHPHTQSRRDTRLLAYFPGFTNAVLCCTTHFQTILICHLEALYQHEFFALFSCFSYWMIVVNVVFLPHCLFSGILGQRVKVDPEVMSYPGQSVNLRCSFSDPTGVQLTMVRNSPCISDFSSAAN